MNSRVFLLVAALALACLALSAQARDLQQVGDEAEALIAQQVAAQEKKNKQYRQFEEDHNNAQEEAAGGGGRKGGKKGRQNSDDSSSSDSSDSSDGGSDGASNPFYGRDPSDLSKSEKRKARREAKKLGLSLEEYLGWTGGSNSGSESSSKKGRNGRRSGPAEDNSSSDVPVTKGRRGKGGKGGKRATYHYYSPAYETSSLYCADAFRGKESGLLGRPWTAWCVGAMKQEYCGRCVRVTNLATGDSVEATVVDMCGTGGVDMDPIGFNAIDSDGDGVRNGFMNVAVEWC